MRMGAVTSRQTWEEKKKTRMLAVGSTSAQTKQERVSFRQHHVCVLSLFVCLYDPEATWKFLSLKGVSLMTFSLDSSFTYFPPKVYDVMDSRITIAGGINLAGKSRSSPVGQNKGLLGNAFMEREVQVNISSSLAFSLPQRNDLWKRCTTTISESPHEQCNINPFSPFTASLFPFIFPLFQAHLGSI